MILFSIGILLVIFSLITNYRGSSDILIKFFFNPSPHSYNFGVACSRFISKNPENPHSLTILSIGLLLIDIEFHFFRKINLDI